VSGAGQHEHATAGVLAHPAGRVLVVIGALAVVGVGIGLVACSATRRLERRLNTGRMSYANRQLVAGLGYIAEGVAIGIAGVLTFLAAGRKARSTGLDGALHTLADGSSRKS
jgi:hypothetical protein